DDATRTEARYSDNTGSWQSIVAVGGSVNPSRSRPPPPVPPAPPLAITSSSPSMPSPFGDKTSSSSYNHPSVYPWIASSPTTMMTSTKSAPGLYPSFSVSNSGLVYPPSSASVRESP